MTSRMTTRNDEGRLPTSTRAARLSLSTALLLPLCLQCTSPTSRDPLVRFETCDELQRFLEERLLHPENVDSSSAVVGCAFDAALGAPEDIGNERTFTTTNTQEDDVDEPDFVKNDGDHIFVLRRGRMIVVDAWPPEQAHIISDTPIEGVPFTMFFDGARALVFARTVEGTLALVFDVSDRANPIVRREVRVGAEFVDARRVGDDVVFVAKGTAVPDVGLRQEPFRDDENRKALRAAGLGSLLPRLRDSVSGEESGESRVAVTCENSWAPRHAASTDLLMTFRLSLVDDQRPIENTTVVGAPGSVYASTENLYIIGTEVFDGGHFTPDFAVTRIHKLGAFTADNATEYRGSAVLEGVVKDELSVDEDVASGTLRVVITKNDDGNGDPLANSSALVVLGAADDDPLQLEEVGRVDDIGNGEVVESVRFLGERAYVVTFPSNDEAFAFDDSGTPIIPFTDPLFVIDLSDPRAPLRRGAIEVDGYSAYLHPLDDDHLLTVGVRTTPNGAFDGLQLSIFDVSDADQPLLTQRALFGDANSGSEALVERHAFTYFPELKTLALPYQHITDDIVDQTALVVFDVDKDAGFRLRGLIDQLPLYVASLETFNADQAPCGAVRRSVLMNDPDLGGYVYAVSTAGITASPLVDELPVVKSVPFPLTAEELCDFTGSPL